jgi:hypothetical protein
VLLDEPTPFVTRFDDFNSDFENALNKTLAVTSNFGEAAQWGESCSWDKVAQLTAEGYRRALVTRCH